jgi:hypothetical protein
MVKDARLEAVKIRLVLSILLAAPLAVLALAIGDAGGLANVARYAVSPGFIFGLQAPSSGSWIGDISNALRIAIAINEVYYAILIFAVLSLLGRGKRTVRTSA